MGKKKTKHNVGAPPGELYYSGVAQTERVKISIIQFNETEFSEQDFYDLSECLKCKKDGYIKWINVDGIHKLNIS